MHHSFVHDVVALAVHSVKNSLCLSRSGRVAEECSKMRMSYRTAAFEQPSPVVVQLAESLAKDLAFRAKD